jgi:hypothetical protein
MTEDEVRALLRDLEGAADIGLAYERAGSREIAEAERELDETRERVVARLMAALRQSEEEEGRSETFDAEQARVMQPLTGGRMSELDRHVIERFLVYLEERGLSVGWLTHGTTRRTNVLGLEWLTWQQNWTPADSVALLRDFAAWFSDQEPG